MGKHFFRKDQVEFALKLIGVETESDRNDAFDNPAIVARALEHVQAEATATLYPALMARDVLPMFTGIDAGADTLVWDEFDSAGMAEVIENYADDPRMVGIAVRENTSKIKAIATGYSYSVEDLERLELARRVNRQAQLDITKAQLADEYIERKIDQLALTGDAAHSIPGFARNANVTTVSAQAAAAGANAPEWNGADKTPLEIFEDLVAMVTTMSNASEGIHEVRVMGLPTVAWNVVAHTLLFDATASPMTILEAFRRQEPGVRVFKWPHLDTAGTGGVPLAIAFDPSPMNMGLVIPREATPEPPQAKNFAFFVPVRAKTGGCVIKRPLSVVYMDDLQS